MTLVPSRAEAQLMHLVRLAWTLHSDHKVTCEIHLAHPHNPTLVIPRASEPLRIMAQDINYEWWFTWGRARRVRALDANAVSKIRELVDT